MRKFAAGVVVGGLVTIALVPGLATSTPEREQATGATPIERRVAALERRAEAQARINRLVQAQVSNLGSRIDLLREDHPRVYDFSGTPIVVEPRTWRTGFASCVLGGTATGGGFDSNRSVEGDRRVEPIHRHVRGCVTEGRVPGRLMAYVVVGGSSSRSIPRRPLSSSR
jgi:hypothetical protein